MAPIYMDCTLVITLAVSIAPIVQDAYSSVLCSRYALVMSPPNRISSATVCSVQLYSISQLK